jgi:hypothetical protein
MVGIVLASAAPSMLPNSVKCVSFYPEQDIEQHSLK